MLLLTTIMIFKDLPMLPITYAHLTDRGIISVQGPDSRHFLPGLISNDVNHVTSN
jgi:folate-binding Fe-S cluster repair protein YgfZ